MVDTASPMPTPTQTASPATTPTNAQLAATNTGVAGYDYTADPFYQAANPQTRAVIDNKQKQDLYNQALGSAGQAWLKGRDPYYQALQQATYNAQAPQIQQQYADSLKAQQLRAAQQGIQKGSQSDYQQNRLATIEQSQLAGADMAGQAAVQAAQAQDQAFVSQWQQFMQNEGQNTANSYAQAQHGQIIDQQQLTAALQAFQNSANQMDAERSARTPQMYGGMLSSAGGGAAGLTKMFMGG